MYPTVTICGSMRWAADMARLAGELTLRGALVLMPHVAKTGDRDEADRLDRMHFEKIRRSDFVLVVTDETYYRGMSTSREIDIARALGIPVDFWLADGPEDQLVVDVAACPAHHEELPVRLDALAELGALDEEPEED